MLYATPRMHASFLRRVAWCAELVAAVLKKGGLMSASSNPGAATPQSLHKLYKNQAAVTANPYTLRQFASSLPPQAWSASTGADAGAGASSSSSSSEGTSGASGASFGGLLEPRPQPRTQPVYRSKSAPRRRGDSPPRASFRCVSVNGELHGYGSSSAVLTRR